MNTIVIIPCHNEQQYIGSLVGELRRKGHKVIVSDDCSTDHTELTANNAGAEVVGCPVTSRHGYGATIHRGVTVALLRYGVPDIIVFMDGDGQHSPDDIEDMLKPILEDRADVVLGSRLGEHDKRPLYRRLSNSFGTWVANVGAQQKLSDAITGYWAIRAKSLPAITERGWGYSFENLMKCRSRKLRITSVPIEAIWHTKSGENSTENPLVLGLIVLWKIIKWRYLCEIAQLNKENKHNGRK